jgi:nucleotide-binding universal stress UspA family protein
LGDFIFKESSVEILVCTDGSDSSLQTADLISEMGFPSTSRISLLGVRNKQANAEKLNESMNLLEQKLGGKYMISRKIRSGDPSEEILSEALEKSYDLVAVGGGGDQLGLLHTKIGSTTSKLARKLHTHFLVSRNLPDKISKILVCVSAEAPASETIPLGGAWIANTSAYIGLLHVTPALKIIPGALQSNASHEMVQPEQDPTLRGASIQLRESGVKNEIIPHLRQGLVVDEVLTELSEGGYQLLVVGAHFQPGQDRWQGLLLDDVTDQLLHRSTCSVLII